MMAAIVVVLKPSRVEVPAEEQRGQGGVRAEQRAELPAQAFGGVLLDDGGDVAVAAGMTARQEEEHQDDRFSLGLLQRVFEQGLVEVILRAFASLHRAGDELVVLQAEFFGGRWRRSLGRRVTSGIGEPWSQR
jgi:hypothetical protein